MIFATHQVGILTSLYDFGFEIAKDKENESWIVCSIETLLLEQHCCMCNIAANKDSRMIIAAHQVGI